MAVSLTGVEVFISQQALSRVRKDAFVCQSSNKKGYLQIISSLRVATTSYPTERIGSFNVSPRGHGQRRIAWHFVIKGTVLNLFIDDLLYHTSGSTKYVDDWNVKASFGKITLRDYGPYVPFVDI